MSLLHLGIIFVFLLNTSSLGTNHLGPDFDLGANWLKKSQKLWQKHSQVSFAEAGFSFSEELVLNIFGAHIETGIGMIRADYLRMKIFTIYILFFWNLILRYIVTSSFKRIWCKRKYILSSKYLSTTIPYLEKKNWPQHVTEELQQGLFHIHGRSTCPSCLSRPPPCITTMKENPTLNCWHEKDLQLKIFSQHATALVCS